jgi:integrase
MRINALGLFCCPRNPKKPRLNLPPCGVYSAHRVKQTCGLVFRYAIATGHAERDPVPDLRGALAAPVGKHYPAITDPVRVGELLRAFDAYTGQPGTRIALKLAALVFQRPGNVIAMRWEDLDLDAATWSIPSENMKRLKVEKVNGAAHVVPLARQSVALLRDLQPLTGAGPYCFPGLRSRDRHISDVTLNAAMMQTWADYLDRLRDGAQVIPIRAA